MSKFIKTRPITPGGRLVTRAQLVYALQKAADQIGEAVLKGLKSVEEEHGARLARIEKELDLPPIDAKPVLVAD